MRTSRICPPCTLADAQNLPKSFGIYSAGYQQRDIADLAGPSALHHDTVEIEIRMLAFDAPVPPSLDLGVDLLIEVRHRARAHPRAPAPQLRYLEIDVAGTGLQCPLVAASPGILSSLAALVTQLTSWVDSSSTGDTRLRGALRDSR